MLPQRLVWFVTLNFGAYSATGISNYRPSPAVLGDLPYSSSDF